MADQTAEILRIVRSLDRKVNRNHSATSTQLKSIEKRLKAIEDRLNDIDAWVPSKAKLPERIKAAVRA